MKRRKVNTYRKKPLFGSAYHVATATGGGAPKTRVKGPTAAKARERLKDKETERQINS